MDKLTEEWIVKYNEMCALYIGCTPRKFKNNAEIIWCDANHGLPVGELKFHDDWEWIHYILDEICKTMITDSYSSYHGDPYELNIWHRDFKEVCGRGLTMKEAHVDGINKFLVQYNQINKVWEHLL